MAHEITIAEAAEMAHQSELIARLIESHPHHLQGCDIAAIARLMARLTGDVTAWFGEEQALREGKV